MTDAAARGVSALASAAAEGHPTLLTRHNRPVAAVVSADRIESLAALERDVLSAALVLSRYLTDDGARHGLDEVIEKFGFTRSELEAELDDDIAAGR